MLRTFTEEQTRRETTGEHGSGFSDFFRTTSADSQAQGETESFSETKRVF